MRKFNSILLMSMMLLLLNFCVTVNAATAAAVSDPVNVLQQIAHHMIAELKANQATLKSKPQIVYRLAYQHVVPHADVAEMSKRVLPPSVWHQATPEQRKQFQAAFTTTLIRTYASALTSYQDQAIRFYPVRGGLTGKNVEVSSEITGAGDDPIHVTYRMVLRSDGWRLYDMSVEGVSMLESFRSQFANMLEQASIAQFLDRMAGHNKRVSS